MHRPIELADQLIYICYLCACISVCIFLELYCILFLQDSVENASLQLSQFLEEDTSAVGVSFSAVLTSMIANSPELTNNTMVSYNVVQSYN